MPTAKTPSVTTRGSLAAPTTTVEKSVISALLQPNPKACASGLSKQGRNASLFADGLLASKIHARQGRAPMITLRRRKDEAGADRGFRRTGACACLGDFGVATGR